MSRRWTDVHSSLSPCTVDWLVGVCGVGVVVLACVGVGGVVLACVGVGGWCLHVLVWGVVLACVVPPLLCILSLSHLHLLPTYLHLHTPYPRRVGGIIRAEVSGRYRRDPRQLDEDEEAWFDTDEGGSSSPPDYRQVSKHTNHTYVAGTNSPRPPVGLHRTNSMPPDSKLYSISTVS